MSILQAVVMRHIETEIDGTSRLLLVVEALAEVTVVDTENNPVTLYSDPGFVNDIPNPTISDSFGRVHVYTQEPVANITVLTSDGQVATLLDVGLGTAQNFNVGTEDDEIPTVATVQSMIDGA